LINSHSPPLWSSSPILQNHLLIARAAAILDIFWAIWLSRDEMFFNKTPGFSSFSAGTAQRNTLDTGFPLLQKEYSGDAVLLRQLC
jgi:uncharacterized oligopeptide transporter (OPT) family protein